MEVVAEKLVEGPFYTEQWWTEGEPIVVGYGKFSILIPEPNGGACIVFTGLNEEQATNLRDRLNYAVAWWEASQERLL